MRFNPEILAVARGSRGITQSAFAEQMKWSQGKASKVEHGMIELDVEDINSVASALGYPTDLFFQDDTIRGFGTCCLYHRKRASTPIRTLNQLHDVINIRRIQLSRALRGVSLPHEVNFPALDLDEYDTPERVAKLLRAAWQLPRGPIKNLFDVVECSGGIVLLMDLDAPKIDAISQRAVGLPPIFFLDRGKPADRCRWTLAHEIGHIVMHQTPSPNAEEEADRFAAEFLMPADEIKQDLRQMSIPKAAAMKLHWRVAMQAIIRRAKDTGAITASAYQSLCVRISQLGYRKNEPNPILPETPKTLRRLFDVYLTDRGYTVSELSHCMLCLEGEFKEIYLSNDNGPRLRLVAQKDPAAPVAKPRGRA
jgi:Zn-dependent peptidase ImmA (M78 family)